MIKLKDDFNFCKLHDIGFSADSYGSKFTSCCTAITIYTNTLNVVIDNNKASKSTIIVLWQLLEAGAIYEPDTKYPAKEISPDMFDFSSFFKK